MVGLDYLTLGQPSNTLSGGECQRLKLAKELEQKGNIYILDEPTTGLHLANVESLLTIIEALVNKGNTVIVIEHHIHVIKNADWLIDIGPGSGNEGGMIVYAGIPREISKAKDSITKTFLG
ncbi:MAG: ATP-binding cassette domain-containing protein [Culicoidibacterales bacterium]